MLKINKNQILKQTFLDAYQAQTAKRKNKDYWSIPKKWEKHIDSVIDTMKNEGIGTTRAIIVFVKVIFNYFTANKCKRFYKMLYPPIFVFKNKYSFGHYWDYQLVEESYLRKGKTQQEIVDIIEKEYNSTNCSKTGNVDIDKLKFSILNGKVSNYTVAYVALKFEFSEKLCREISEFTTTATGEALINYHEVVKHLLEEGRLH